MKNLLKLLGVVMLLGAGCSAQTNIQAGAPSSTGQPSGVQPEIIEQREVVVEGKTLVLAHICEGESKEERGIRFCLGKNRVELINQDNDTRIVIPEIAVSSSLEAPSLMRAERIPSAVETGRILLSYEPNPCRLEDDCGGAGPRGPLFTHVWSARPPADPARRIHQYPSGGGAYWNPSGTKAIFIPDTCGGAGCLPAPLSGYDLAKDSFTTLTQERAVDQQATKSDGSSVPVWVPDIVWKGDNNAVATIVDPNGTSRKVNVVFN